MDKKAFIILLLILNLCFPAIIFAETILLKSGKTVEGKLIEKTDGYIKIDFQGVPLTYFYDEIESIDGEKPPIVQTLSEKNVKVNQSPVISSTEKEISKDQQEVKTVMEKQETSKQNTNRKKINNVQDLAKALKEEGIDYQKDQKSPSKTITCPRTNRQIKIDEEISVLGNNVAIVIDRINDKETFESIKPIFEVSLAMMELKYMSPKGSVTTNFKYPFLVTVIKEPAKSSVNVAMERIFPGEKIEVIAASEEGYRFVDNLKSQLSGILK